MMSTTKRVVALPAGLVMIIMAATIAWAATDREQDLELSLTVPHTCEIDSIDTDATSTLVVEWQVVGGESPYEVFVEGSRFTEAEGIAELQCGVWSGSDVDSGLFAVQAYVRDAVGATAGALSYANAVRSIREDGSDGPGYTDLQAGLTYRVHGVLLTVPNAFDLHLGDYVSADCSDLDGPCDDRFQIFTGSWNTRDSHIWIRRWPAEEISREIHNKGSLNEDAVDAAFDQLVGSINLPASELTPASVSGSDTSDLTLRMIAPAICEETGSYWSPSQSVVAWEVSGGVAPYRIVIDGYQVGPAAGDIHVQCGRLHRGLSDSGLHTVHGIVIDSKGNVASRVVHTYGIKNDGGGGKLRGGETYRVFGQLLTIPEGITAETGGYEHSSCDAPTGDDRFDPAYCEDAFHLGISSGDVSSSLWFGVVSGRSYGSEPRETSPAVGLDHPIHAQLRALVESVGQPPTLPVDLGNQLAPLSISAYVDPVGCQLGLGYTAMASSNDGGWINYDGGEVTSEVPLGGGAVNLYWTVTGGYWTPVIVSISGRDPSAHRMVLTCPEEVGEHEITLTASEQSDPPQTAELVVGYQSRASSADDALQLSVVPYLSGHCRPGETVLIGRNAYSEHGQVSVSIDGVEGQFGPGVAMEVRCQQEVGAQTVTVRAFDEARPPHRSITTLQLMVTEAPPTHVRLIGVARPLQTETCSAGERVRIAWRAIGGVPPYQVTVPADETAEVDGNEIELDCPADQPHPYVVVEIADSNVVPTTLRDYVSFEIASDTKVGD